MTTSISRPDVPRRHKFSQTSASKLCAADSSVLFQATSLLCNLYAMVVVSSPIKTVCYWRLGFLSSVACTLSIYIVVENTLQIPQRSKYNTFLNEFSASTECLKQKHTPEFQNFCQKRSHSRNECQKLELKLPKKHSTAANSTVAESSPPCKTIWITGMSMGFAGKHHVADGGDGYVLQYAAALRSYQAHAKEILQPVLVLMTPRPSSSSTENTLASRFTR